MAVEGKLGAQQVFQLQFLHFALQLLRALLGPALEVFDLLLHRGDGLLLFHYLELLFVLGFFFGLLRVAVKPSCTRFSTVSSSSRLASSSSRCFLISSACAFWASASFASRLFSTSCKFGQFPRLCSRSAAAGLLRLFGFFGGDPGAVLFQLLCNLIGDLLVELALWPRRAAFPCRAWPVRAWRCRCPSAPVAVRTARRVASISGAASDSVSLISVLQFGQMMVGSVIAASSVSGACLRYGGQGPPQCEAAIRSAPWSGRACPRSGQSAPPAACPPGPARRTASAASGCAGLRAP